MSNTFGTIFKVSTFGESHCPAVGAVVDGCPPRIAINETIIQKQLDRRRPGQSNLSTPRSEEDRVTIVSGVENGVTLGTPICCIVANKDQRPGDYSNMTNIPRPSHADYTYRAKYGIKTSSGGGRASARETIGRVAAGAIAETVLAEKFGVEIVAWVGAVGEIHAPLPDIATIDRLTVDGTAVRCPDKTVAEQMAMLISSVRDEKDSVGGVIHCVVRGASAGWGDPVFDKIEARLAAALLSIPAAKGFDIGSGFAGAMLRGSENNDPFEMRNGTLGTLTNNSGGVAGGITNGEPIVFRVAFKPTATIGKKQFSVDYDGVPVEIEAAGRHDPCVVPRAVPIVEAMTALVLADCALLQHAYAGL